MAKASSRKKISVPVPERIAQALMCVAGKKSWNRVTLAAVAREAKLPLSTLREHFDDRTEIFGRFLRMIDRQVLDDIGPVSAADPARDRLFDIILQHYEALQDYKPGIAAIISALRRDPARTALFFPYICRTVYWLREAGGVSSRGVSGVIGIPPLAFVYIRGLMVWTGDDSPDLSATMAALDKDLSRAARLPGLFGFAAE